MKIYKQNDIKRMAGQLLTNDFNDNEQFHFTNASYGGRGEVMGTIEAKNKKGEHLIQYVLVHKDWKDKNYDLIRSTEDKFWKTATTEYKKLEDEQLIKRFYIVSGSYDCAVYTDDEDYAKQAQETRYNRYSLQDRKPSKKVYKLDGDHTIKPNTPLYNKLFTMMAEQTGKPLKYGSEIEVGIIRHAGHYEYNFKDNTRITGTEIQFHVRVMYRNKWQCHCKRKIFIPEKVEQI